MINEELIEGLKQLTHTMKRDGDSYFQRITEDAIKALEQEPTDAVSRSELQKTMDSLPSFSFVNNGHEEADDYYSCESVDMVIRNLPPVTPQPKMGRWVNRTGNRKDGYEYTCDSCKKISLTNFKYCPNCGARMEVKE